MCKRKSRTAYTKEAVNRGLDVTAIVRGENKSAAKKVITKDLFDLTAEDLKGFDAVVDAFGAWTPDVLPQHSTSLKHLCDLLSGNGCALVSCRRCRKPLCKSGTHGSGYGRSRLSRYVQAACRQHRDKALEELRTRNDVKWTFISPAGDFQADGARTGKYILGGEELGAEFQGRKCNQLCRLCDCNG